MLVNMERRCLGFASEILNVALKHRVQIVTNVSKVYTLNVSKVYNLQSVTLKSLPVNVKKRPSKFRLLTNRCLKTQLVKLRLKTVSCLQDSITVNTL